MLQFSSYNFHLDTYFKNSSYFCERNRYSVFPFIYVAIIATLKSWSDNFNAWLISVLASVRFFPKSLELVIFSLVFLCQMLCSIDPRLYSNSPNVDFSFVSLADSCSNLNFVSNKNTVAGHVEDSCQTAGLF